MQSETFLNALQSSWLATLVDGSRYTAMAIQVIHILSFTFLLALMLAFNIRMQGLALHAVPASQFARVLQRPFLLAFIVAVSSGFLLLLPRATVYAANEPFVWKMGFLLVAASMQFQLLHSAARAPLSSSHAEIAIAADVSSVFRRFSLLALLLWLATGVAGRVIGFV